MTKIFSFAACIVEKVNANVAQIIVLNNFILKI